MVNFGNSPWLIVLTYGELGSGGVFDWLQNSTDMMSGQKGELGVR